MKDPSGSQTIDTPPPPPPRSSQLSSTGRFQASRGAWVVFSLFLLAGLVVLDDYGVAADEKLQRRITEANLSYILGAHDDLQLKQGDKHYGVAFELPLLLAERLFGLEDTRSIYLSRHLLTHLFFLLGGLCCYLLALRLFNNRLLALFAMLLFLLHPRLYAHSFVNSKDIPFFSMFMIALLLIHRAFARDTVRAFLLCGAAVAVLINLRVMGVMLLIAVVVMRGLDVWYAEGRQERIRVLKTLGGFILSSVLVLYAVWPYLWEDPLGRLAEAITIASRFPRESIELFKGTLVHSTDLPWDYLPTWFLITTPWVALLLGFIGIVAVGYRGFIQPSNILRNTQLRFQWLLLACFILPILAIIVLRPTLYSGWRHMHFLYAPFCLLAAFGLYQLVLLSKKKHWRVGVYALTGIGLVGVVVEMAQIHPYQNVYFNALVDRRTPESLRNQYEMDYWRTSYREGLEYLLEHYPNSPVHISGQIGWITRNRTILPATERQRVKKTARSDFYLDEHRRDIMKRKKPVIFNSIHTIKIYDNTILAVQTTDLTLLDESDQVFYRNVYHEAKADVSVTRSFFDVYTHDGKLVYLRESCHPDDPKASFFLHVFPVNEADLPDLYEYLAEHKRPKGFENLDFGFPKHGVRFDGKCMAVVPLPEYEINSINTGQFTNEGKVWSVGLKGKFSLKQD